MDARRTAATRNLTRALFVLTVIGLLLPLGGCGRIRRGFVDNSNRIGSVANGGTAARPPGCTRIDININVDHTVDTVPVRDVEAVPHAGARFDSQPLRCFHTNRGAATHRRAHTDQGAGTDRGTERDPPPTPTATVAPGNSSRSFSSRDPMNSSPEPGPSRRTGCPHSRTRSPDLKARPHRNRGQLVPAICGTRCSRRGPASMRRPTFPRRRRHRTSRRLESNRAARQGHARGSARPRRTGAPARHRQRHAIAAGSAVWLLTICATTTKGRSANAGSTPGRRHCGLEDLNPAYVMLKSRRRFSVG